MSWPEKRKADEIAYREHLEKEDPNENCLLEEAVKELGFENEQEFHRLVASIDFSTVEKRKIFKDWQYNDGTKVGLLKLFNKEK